jgi:hypothetical protein
MRKYIESMPMSSEGAYAEVYRFEASLRRTGNEGVYTEVYRGQPLRQGDSAAVR